MKVYITSRGTYSDYQLDRVFASEALAKDYLAFQQQSSEYPEVNDEVIEEEVLEAPLTARVRHLVTSTWGEKGAWSRKPNQWTELDERTYVQVLGDEAAIYDDDPRLDVHVSIGDSKGRSADWLAHYGNEVTIRVMGWDLERVRKVFGEVKAQKMAEILGIG